MIWIIFIAVMVLSFIIQNTLQSRFRKYSQVPLRSGMTGAEVAMKMLNDNGIYDVKVVPHNGMLTDHYNPATKTVALSGRPQRGGIFQQVCRSRGSRGP